MLLVLPFSQIIERLAVCSPRGFTERSARVTAVVSLATDVLFLEKNSWLSFKERLALRDEQNSVPDIESTQFPSFKERLALS